MTKVLPPTFFEFAAGQETDLDFYSIAITLTGFKSSLICNRAATEINNTSEIFYIFQRTETKSKSDCINISELNLSLNAAHTQR